LDRACQRALHDLDELEAVLSVLLVEAIEKGDDETATLLGAAFDEERRRVHDLVDFRMNSMKRVPVLSGGDGKWRQPKLYGSSSNYGRDHSQPLLVRALRLERDVRFGKGCQMPGEECLLILLAYLAFPKRMLEM
jgi:hypothetical protein